MYGAGGFFMPPRRGPSSPGASDIAQPSGQSSWSRSILQRFGARLCVGRDQARGLLADIVGRSVLSATGDEVWLFQSGCGNAFPRQSLRCRDGFRESGRPAFFTTAVASIASVNSGRSGHTQLSVRRPGTLANSRRLLVTSTASSASACAAIIVSSAPMGWPRCSSALRSSP